MAGKSVVLVFSQRIPLVEGCLGFFVVGILSEPVDGLQDCLVVFPAFKGFFTGSTAGEYQYEDQKWEE